MTLNERYGLSKPHHHDLNGIGECKKCNKHVSKIKLKLCLIMGKEEVAQLSDPISDSWLGRGSNG